MTNPHEQVESANLSTDQIAGIAADTYRTRTQTAERGGRESQSTVKSTRPDMGASTDDDLHGEDSGLNLDSKNQPVQLLDEDELQGMLERWREIQSDFVDEPRRAIDDADALVADLLQRLARGFAQQRQHLEDQLHSSSEVSTEDMRQGLRRYRSFFERLLAA